jgi:hypothetical protein
MSKVKWLVEADVFDDNQDALIAAIKAQGFDHHILKYVPFDDDLVNRCSKIYGPEECVVFYGSLNFGHKLRKLSWVPGVYLNEKAFECTSYYPVFHGELLHENYIMMPYGDLLNKKDWLFSIFPGGKLFIRPNSGIKEFTGFVCEYNTFEDAVKLAAFYDVESNLLCLVSRAHNIDLEWRFVIVDGEPMSGSLYRDWSRPEKIDDGFSTKDYVLRHSHEKREYALHSENKELWEYVEKIAKLYEPDKCWTIDICTSQEKFKVLEIGCFSCAGMYANNMGMIVNAVSDAALEEWEDYYGNTQVEETSTGD